MRDAIVMIAFLGLLPLCFSRPFIGMLVWTWFTIMNPHRETFGFAYTFQFNTMIAVATLTGMLLSGERLKPLTSRYVWILYAWFGWTILTTFYAIKADYSYEFFMRIPFKVYLFIFLLTIMVNREERVFALLWILLLSIGYYGTNIGVMGILKLGRNLGESADFGPQDTLLQDRNHMAVALCMIIPLLHYLSNYCEQLFTRRVLTAVMVLCVIAVFVSYSRGGWICLIFIGAYYFWFVKNKAIYIITMIFASVSSLAFLPQEWFDRMNFEKIDKDESLNVRFEMWKIITELFYQHPIMGGGFRAAQHPDIFKQLADGISDLKVPFAAHSIYYEVLGEHGGVGLFLFLSVILAGVLSNFNTRKMTKGRPEFDWARDLSNALQLSILVYALGGAALSLAYFETFYVVLVLSFSLNILVRKNYDELSNSEKTTRKNIPQYWSY